MLLGFKARFVPFIEDGSKTHTIRGIRKITPKVGEICHCYTGLRQKGARLLGRFPCVKIEEILIDSQILSPTATKITIWIDGFPLHWDEKNQLAWRDGFRDAGRAFALVRMMQFWEGRLPFVGTLIHWDFARKIMHGGVDRSAFRVRSRSTAGRSPT